MFLDKLQERKISLDDFHWGGLTSSFYADELKESTYFKCIKKLSESVAKVPVELLKSDNEGENRLKNHSLYNILRNRPNPYMSSLDFFKAMEAIRQHRGDSFALIVRNKAGVIEGLYPLDYVRLIVDDVGLCKSTKTNKVIVEYIVNSFSYYCFYEDVLHFKGFTLDGLNSINVKDSLRDTLNTNKSSQNYQMNLFKNGLTNKAVVQMTSDIKDEKELKKIQAKFERLFSAGNRVYTVPAGYNITPLNLSLVDSQFSELKKMGAIDIATAYGIPPYMLGFMESYNNNSLEQSSLAFLVDTLLILFESIEQELNYKLLTPSEINEGLNFKFNVGVLLRTSQQQQAEIITKYVASGIYTPNEARRLLGFNKCDNGDDLLVNAGVLKIKDIGKSLEGGEE